MVSFSIVVILGSMSVGCLAAPPHQPSNGNNPSADSREWPESRVTLKTPKYFITRRNDDEAVPGFLRQLNKLEDRLKRIGSERLDGMVGKFRASIMRFKDILQPTNGKHQSSATRSPNTRINGGWVNATNSSTRAKDSTSGVMQTTSTSERHDFSVAVTDGYEAYTDQLIHGGFVNFEHVTSAPSIEYVTRYLKMNSTNKAGTAHSTERSNTHLKVDETHRRDIAHSTEHHGNPYINVNGTHKGGTGTAHSVGHINPNSKVYGTHKGSIAHSTEHSNTNLKVVNNSHKEHTAHSAEHHGIPYINVNGTHKGSIAHSTGHSNTNLKVANNTHKEHTAHTTEHHGNPYINVNGTHKRDTADPAGYKGFTDAYNSSINRKVISVDETTGSSRLPKNTTSDIAKNKEEFNNTKKQPEDIIAFIDKEDSMGDVVEEEYVMTKVFVKEESQIVTTAVKDTSQERPNATVVDNVMVKELFTPASDTGVKTSFTSTDCMCESCIECYRNVSTVVSENTTRIFQKIIKAIESRSQDYSDLIKSYVKRQTPDVLAFTSELSQEEEDSAETAAKDDYRDGDYDESKQGEDEKQSASDVYGLQNSDNTYVASTKNAVNFTREIELLDRTVGFYASIILELLPRVREGYLNNKFTEKEVESFEKMFGSMWTLINNTDLIDNITRSSNVSDATANEDVVRAFRNIEANGDKTLVRKPRSVSGDERNLHKRHRHSSMRAEEKKRKRTHRRKQTRDKTKEHESTREPNKHVRKHKRKHTSGQMSGPLKRIEKNRSRRRPRSHDVENATIVSEAAAILALLAEAGGSIQLDAPDEDDDYDEGYDYMYDDDYDATDQDYYRDEGEDASSELARYYNNDDDPSVRELISLASKHRDRKARLTQSEHETAEGEDKL